MTDDHWIPIDGVTVCGSCQQLHGTAVQCLCTTTSNGKIQDERGDERMRDLKYPCPHCGQSHLMILGATVKTDKDGSLIAVCPNSNTNTKRGD